MESTTTAVRAARHAALGDAIRLAIVDELGMSDRSPLELGSMFGVESNLLAHHLDVLQSVGMIRRSKSSGDGRRRYVHLIREALDGLAPGRQLAAGRALFVCTRNSARSQLAAVLWQSLTGAAAESAGTHPAERVHPGAFAAAKRAGLDLSGATPRTIRRGQRSAEPRGDRLRPGARGDHTGRCVAALVDSRPRRRWQLGRHSTRRSQNYANESQHSSRS